MKPVEAVFFDLDDTLIDDYAATRACVERTCLEFQGCVPGFDRALVARTYEAIGQKFWIHTVRPDVDDYAARLSEIRAANWQETLATCGIRVPGLASEFAAFYAQLRAETVIAFEGASAVLEALRPHVRLGVITNGAGVIQRNKLEVTGLAGYFDIVICSTDVGFAKPDPAIFETALSATGAEASASWHIGDNLNADVAGALGAGLNAAWMNRGRGARPVPLSRQHAEIKSLRDVLPLLGLE